MKKIVLFIMMLGMSYSGFGQYTHEEFIQGNVPSRLYPIKVDSAIFFDENWDYYRYYTGKYCGLYSIFDLNNGELLSRELNYYGNFEKIIDDGFGGYYAFGNDIKSDPEPQELYHLNPEGKIDNNFNFPKVQYISNIFLDSSKNLILAGSINGLPGSILKFDKNGKLLDSICLNLSKIESHKYFIVENYLYIYGDFDKVNNRSSNGLIKFNLNSFALDTNFNLSARIKIKNINTIYKNELIATSIENNSNSILKINQITGQINQKLDFDKKYYFNQLELIPNSNKLIITYNIYNDRESINNFFKLNLENGEIDSTFKLIDTNDLQIEKFSFIDDSTILSGTSFKNNNLTYCRLQKYSINTGKRISEFCINYWSGFNILKILNNQRFLLSSDNFYVDGYYNKNYNKYNLDGKIDSNFKLNLFGWVSDLIPSIDNSYYIYGNFKTIDDSTNYHQMIKVNKTTGEINKNFKLNLEENEFITYSNKYILIKNVPKKTFSLINKLTGDSFNLDFLENDTTISIFKFDSQENLYFRQFKDNISKILKYDFSNNILDSNFIVFPEGHKLNYFEIEKGYFKCYVTLNYEYFEVIYDLNKRAITKYLTNKYNPDMKIYDDDINDYYYKSSYENNRSRYYTIYKKNKLTNKCDTIYSFYIGGYGCENNNIEIMQYHPNGFLIGSGCFRNVNGVYSKNIFRIDIDFNKYLDVEENEQIPKSNNISISPNPASDYIEISLSPAGGGWGWTYEIYNIFGEKISTPSRPLPSPLRRRGSKKN